MGGGGGVTAGVAPGSALVWAAEDDSPEEARARQPKYAAASLAAAHEDLEAALAQVLG